MSEMGARMLDCHHWQPLPWEFVKRCLALNQVQPRFNTPPTRLTCVDFICRPQWSCLHVHEEEEGGEAGAGGGEGGGGGGGG